MKQLSAARIPIINMHINNTAKWYIVCVILHWNDEIISYANRNEILIDI